MLFFLPFIAVMFVLEIRRRKREGADSHPDAA